MFKIAVVIFRECLEIALLLGVIMAVTKPIKNSRLYIIIGLLLGVVFASTFAFFARLLTKAFSSYGDELFDSAVILLTAIIISWTVVWMQGYTEKIKKNFGLLSNKIDNGVVSKFTLIVVVAMTILREGAEILLFIYSIASAENISINDYFWGLAIGGISGFFVGSVIYLGLVKFAGKYIFKISTLLLILISAGLSAEAAGILTSSGFIEIYSEQLWDTSWFIDNNSIVGKLLNIITGYDSKPNGMQLIFYFGTIIFTILMMKLRSIFHSGVKNV